MSIQLTDLLPEHFARLHEIHISAEPLFCADYEAFHANMLKRTGFTLVDIKDDGAYSVIGAITFTSYCPPVDIFAHVTVMPEFHGKWLTPEIFKRVFDYAFIELNLPRCSAYYFPEINPRVGGFLRKLGFLHEGTIRKGAVGHGGALTDMHLCGLLREERRW